MKPGDQVVPLRPCNIHDIKEPTFSSRGRTRLWDCNQVAIIVGQYTRVVGRNNVLKFQILLDGERWWISAASCSSLKGEV